MTTEAAAEGRPALAVRLGDLELDHPLVNASGTFDAVECAGRVRGDLFADFPFAAYVPKTVTAAARTGNPPPRVTETACGMLNAIGLENPGIEEWLCALPALAALRQPLVLSVGGNSLDEYAQVVRRAEEHRREQPRATPRIVAYELNVSCPNVVGGAQIGADPAATAAVVAAVRAETDLPLFTKLTPNVADVRVPAGAALEAGSTGISLVNTFKAMALDPQTLRPCLGNRTGGLCGPAVKPIALRMVAEVAEAFPGVPVIAMGGVTTGLDALEFIACGATAVAVGAANFTGIEAPRRILHELADQLVARGFAGVTAARGVAIADHG